MKRILDREAIRNVIHQLVITKDDGTTYVFQLDTDDFGRIWALVIAWQGGYEEKYDTPFQYGDKRIAMKIAWKSGNAPLSDYDIDWLMPYDTETGDVDDCELSIESDNIGKDLDWLEKTYKRFKKEYFKKEMRY